MSKLLELQAELQAINTRLAIYKHASSLEKQREARVHATPLEPKLRAFSVLTESMGNSKAAQSYVLHAHTINPKHYARQLHQETGCTVRSIISPMLAGLSL